MALNRRIARRIRKFRIFSALIVTSLTVVSFQNCAPAPLCEGSDCSQNETSGTTTAASTGNSTSDIWGSRPADGSSGIGIGAGSGSSSGNGMGSGSAGGGIGVGSGSSSGGSSSSSGGGSTFTNNSQGSANDTAFKIAKQPEGVKVNEDGEFILEVAVSGGTAPYSFQWYANKKAISGGLGSYSYYRTTADSWHKEGTYHVVIKDAKGQSLQSSLARVTINEPAVGCKAGKYFTYTNQTYDEAYQYFTEYFDGPRGKFLLHQSYDTYNMLLPYPSYSKLTHFNVPENLDYLGKTWISCRTNIPRIHTPAVNPNYEEYYDRYADTSDWQYQGTVTFECRNMKLKLVSNTCKWVRR